MQPSRLAPLFVLFTVACSGSDANGPPSTQASGGSSSTGGFSGGGNWSGGGGGLAGASPGTGGDPGNPTCGVATTACSNKSQCCDGLECGTTTLGQVCCGMEGASCATENGEDCCGDLLCVNGACGYDTGSTSCEGPCFPAPALAIEKQRLTALGGDFLGICGDENHLYGYHLPAAKLPDSDYSMQGAANDPVCEWHACAIDIGMNWSASRDWLKWLIGEIASDNIKGIAEVIGSYDGYDVRYWSDSSGWSVNGIPYDGSGHDSWTHVSIYRSTALDDHHILSGWTANGGP